MMYRICIRETDMELKILICLDFISRRVGVYNPKFPYMSSIEVYVTMDQFIELVYRL